MRIILRWCWLLVHLRIDRVHMPMERNKKGEYIGMVGTLLVHLAVGILLLLLTLAVSKPDEEKGGIPVVLGDSEAAQGWNDPSLINVDILNERATIVAETEADQFSEENLVVQEQEETVAVKPLKEKKREATPHKSMPIKKEKSEAEKVAEAQRLAEEKVERERRAAEEAARKNVANAFGKGSQMEPSRGTAVTGNGVEGVPTGYPTSGAHSGTGGYGTFDLGGRALGRGSSLPKPIYAVQEEGRVVVNITVNPAGVVIATSINLSQTRTSNQSLRRAAEEAARKARFEAVNGVNNQVGTITYYFNLR